MFDICQAISSKMLPCTVWCLFARGEDELRMAAAIVDIMVVIFSITLNHFHADFE